MSILTPHNPWAQPIACPYIKPSTPNNLGNLQELAKIIYVAEPVSPNFGLKNGIFELAVILPGYLKTDVAITITNNKLNIKAEKGGLDGTGTYSLSTPLPTNAGPVSVSLIDGILRVTMPETLPPVINIQIT